jgi:hypothetical protein
MKPNPKDARYARPIPSMISGNGVSIIRYPTHTEVADHASALWERSGKPQDQDIAIWLEAERQLRSGALMAEAASNAFTDTMALLGESTGSMESRLQSFGGQLGARSTTSL